MFTDLNRDLKQYKVVPGVASHKFQQNIIKGLIDNNVQLKVINIPVKRFFPHYRTIFSKKSRFAFQGENIGRMKTVKHCSIE